MLKSATTVKNKKNVKIFKKCLKEEMYKLEKLQKH